MSESALGVFRGLYDVGVNCFVGPFFHEIGAPIPLHAFREERIEQGLEGWIGNFAHPVEEGWGQLTEELIAAPQISHACILGSFTTQEVFCRGNNNNTQSGTAAPGFVPGTVFSVDVAAGGYHTCAVELDSTTPTAGSVMCWRENGDGQVTGTPSGDVTSPFLLTVP